MRCALELHLPDGTAEYHVIPENGLLIGRSNRVSIRIPDATVFTIESLELSAGERDVGVQVPNGVMGQFRFEGREYRAVRVPFGGEIFVGNARLHFHGGASENQTKSHALVTLAVALSLIGLAVHHASGPGVTLTENVSAPRLLDEDRAVPCTSVDFEEAVKAARDAERAAAAKRQRSLFATGDGVAAFALMRQAESCLRAAGELAAAGRLRREADAWRIHLDEYYADLRVRLRVALDASRTSDAQVAIRQLQDLLSHHEPGPYHRWLERLSVSLEPSAARHPFAAAGD